MTSKRNLEIDALRERLLQGDRRALGKGITLVESTQEGDEAKADQLLTDVIPRSGNSLRVGVSGSPGVGKSTFIEALGMSFISRGKRVAVLAIDPSSPVTGGSILGDKTRMERLAVSEHAFIRPSPSGDISGGVARHTRESIILCEAAGYDLIIVETVGVGQSDVVASSMVDYFILIQQPYAGDELQGIKRGILEMADLICVTKADGDALQAAQRTKGELDQSLSFGYGHRDSPARVFLVSKEDLSSIEAVGDFVSTLTATAPFKTTQNRRRSEQSKDWLDQEIRNFITEFVIRSRKSAVYQKTLLQVTNGHLPASAAARAFGQTILKASSTSDNSAPN